MIDLIPLEDPPTFADPTPWSAEFVDFVDQCLTRNPAQRPSSKELLQVINAKFFANSFSYCCLALVYGGSGR